VFGDRGQFYSLTPGSPLHFLSRTLISIDPETFANGNFAAPTPLSKLVCLIFVFESYHQKVVRPDLPGFQKAPLMPSGLSGSDYQIFSYTSPEMPFNVGTLLKKVRYVLEEYKLQPIFFFFPSVTVS